MDARMVPSPYCGHKLWENGARDSAWFETYEDLCRWLAADPDAGIGASNGGVPIDQQHLQEDVATYLE